MNKSVCLAAFLVLLLGEFPLVWADETITVTGGDHYIYDSYLPVYIGAMYSYSQQIYDAALIGRSGEITALRFLYSHNSLPNSDEWTVYLGHTVQDYFSGTGDWISEGLEEVYSGTVQVVWINNLYWVEINLEPTFEYYNSHNLVVTVNETSEGSADDPLLIWWVSFNRPNHTALTFLSDDPITSPGIAGNMQSYNSVIQLDFEDEEALPVQLASFSATLSAENYVNLNWVSQSETGMNGYYVYRADFADLASAQLISQLIPATNTSTQHSYGYTDHELYADGTYHYWLQSLDLDGQNNFHGPVNVIYSVNGGQSNPGIPQLTELKAVYPNPFNPVAFIPYSIASASEVNIRIFNNRGQLVWMRHPGIQIPGEYSLVWDGQDMNGQPLASGVYNIKMTAGKESYTRKAVLMK